MRQGWGMCRGARRAAGALAMLLAPLALMAPEAHALDAVAVDDMRPVLDITPYLERYPAAGNRLILEEPSAPGDIVTTGEEESAAADEEGGADADADTDAGDGSILLSDGGDDATGEWIAIALRNRSEDVVSRLVVADDRPTGFAGLFWPRIAGGSCQIIWRAGRLPP